MLQMASSGAETPLQLLTIALGVAFFVVAYWGHIRWTAHTAAALVRVLATLGASVFLFTLTVPDPPVYQLVWLYSLLAVPIVFALFSFRYYGSDFPSSRARLAGFVAPAALAALAGTLLSFDATSMGAGARLLTPVLREHMTTGASGMDTIDPATMRAPLATSLGIRLVSLPEWSVGIVLAIVDLGVYYVSGVTLIAGGLILRSVTRYEHLETGLGVSLAFVGVWPWIAYGFMPVVTDLYAWEAAVVGIAGAYVLSLGAVGVAIGRYGLFESEPAAGNIGSTTVLSEMTDSVFVLDRGGNVLRLNAAAERTFGTPEREAVGRPLSAVIDTDTEALRAGNPVELETTEGPRQFDPTHSTVSGPDDTPRGDVFVLRDITRRRTRQQRLQVLSRVLRHNIRNDMNVIRGQADLISDGGGGTDPAESAATIREKSDQLISISERAREAQQIVADDDPVAETDVGAVASAIHEEMAERYPAVELSVAVPDGTRAAVDSGSFEIVLRNLVENACEHNDAESPIVVTSADRTDDGMVRVLVRDNGPGIPEMERAVIETGVEDPLEHGSGMGLWTVKWGVTQMGGRLSFAENAPRGTVVQLEVPAADRR